MKCYYIPNIVAPTTFRITFTLKIQSNGLMACEKILSLLHSDLLGKRVFTYIHTAAFINDCVFLGLIPGRGLLTIILSRTAASWLWMKQTGRNKRHCWNSYRMMHTSVDCKWTTPVLRLFSRSLRRSLWSLPLLTKFCLNEDRWVRVRKLIWLSGTHLSVLTALRSLVLPTGLGLSSLSSASISSAMQMHTLSRT